MSAPPEPLIQGIAHVNLSIPPGTLDQAKSFYGSTLGLTPRAGPAAQVHELAWFDVGPPPSSSSSSSSGPQQQIHISIQKHDRDTTEPRSSRHPCFHLGSRDALVKLQRRILEHKAAGGGDAPLECDEVGESSGETTADYPTRFFARDYSGNRLEFTT